MPLEEQLRGFAKFWELGEAKFRLILTDLEEQEFITSKQQLFRLDDKSWKNIAIMDMLVRDGLEAWINDELQPIPELDSTPIDSVLERLVTRVGWSPEEASNLVILMGSLGITKFKHLRPLKKKTMYKVALPVLLVQELKQEVKDMLKARSFEDTENITSRFRLPIVGSADSRTPTEDLSDRLATRFTIKSGNRVVREIGGRTYEFDQKCPHKSADLTHAPVENGILICPKHKWKFDLNNGGRCISKPYCTINARLLEW